VGGLLERVTKIMNMSKYMQVWKYPNETWHIVQLIYANKNFENIFGSAFHIWEKTCGLCVSESGLLHLTGCPPIASIYLQTTSLFFMAE
jgi:hypothetical protein